MKEANLYNLYLISGEPVSVDNEGILLSRAFKDRTTIKPGDIIELDVPFLQKTVQILVTGFVDDRSGYGGFLPLGKIQEIFGLDDKVTGVMIKLSNSTYEKEVKERLYQNYPVLFVESTEETKKDWVAMLNLYTGFIGTILSFGVAIALAIIFNTVTISILERDREFATMRTFGMGIRRIASMITIENLLIVILGIVLGLPLGTFLAEYFLGLFSSEYFSFTTVIYPPTYVLTATGILVVLLLSEIPGIRHVYSLSLSKITKELES